MESSIAHEEERIFDDAVYKVSLKKENYPCRPHENNDGSYENCGYLQHRHKLKSKIIYGTLEKLIESFVQKWSESIDCCHLNILLLTYRTFTSTSTLLVTLESKFVEIINNPNISDEYKLSFLTAVRTFLSMWLESENVDDFNTPPDYKDLENMLKMVLKWGQSARKSHIRDDFKVLESRILSVLEKLHNEHTLASGMFREVLVGRPSHYDHLFDEILPPPKKFSDKGNHLKRQPIHSNSIDLGGPIRTHSPLTTFQDLDVLVIAEQLTLIDKELLQRVLPHQCLARVRGKPAPTVDATIRHFNKVVSIVVTTILRPDPNPFGEKTSSLKAKVISKWIAVAAKLRELKNFSTFRAVISGLQSHDIFQLEHCWQQVEKLHSNYYQIYQELAKLASAENNQESARKLLQNEGAAKHSEIDKKQSVKPSIFKRIASGKQQHPNSVVYGTIPYIGIFLHDLTMIHENNPEMVSHPHHPDSPPRLINFEKHRKEFAILAAIPTLFQKSLKNYEFSRDAIFHRWFDNIQLMTQEEITEASKEERESRLSRGNSDLTHNRQKFHILKESDSASNTSGIETSGISSGLNSGSLSSKTSSISEEGVLKDSSASSQRDKPPSVKSLSALTPEHLVIKMRLNLDSDSASTAGVNYKAIKVSNSDKVNTVIKNTFEKMFVDEDPLNFCLIKIFSDGKELVIPDNNNVYYALGDSCTKEDIFCEIRRKKVIQLDSRASSVKSKANEPPASPKLLLKNLNLNGHSKSLSVS